MKAIELKTIKLLTSKITCIYNDQHIKDNEAWEALFSSILEFCSEPTPERAIIMYDLEYKLLGSYEHAAWLSGYYHYKCQVNE